MKTLILYMPVLHAGYLKLFEEVVPETIYLLSEKVLQELPEEFLYLTKKDIIRAIPAEEMQSVVQVLFPNINIRCPGLTELADLGKYRFPDVVMPDEDVSRAIAERYFGDGSNVRFVVPPAPRLRYHRNNIEEKKLLVAERRVDSYGLDREMMALAANAAQRSPDWWRQVGGVLRFTDGKYIVGYNEHQPHEQIVATFGDPRALFKSGVRTDLTHGDHAEHVLIGEAARQGLSVEGASMYLTTFPCLACARLTARAGVKRLFYRDPSYGLLDADEELRKKGVELIEVHDE